MGSLQKPLKLITIDFDNLNCYSATTIRLIAIGRYTKMWINKAEAARIEQCIRDRNIMSSSKNRK